LGFFNRSKKQNHKAPSDQASFHFRQGDKAFQKGKYKQAREEVQKAIELDPSLSDARKLFERICFSLALEKSGRIDEVISLLKECIQVNPDTMTHAELGRIYEWQKRSDEANREYRELLKKHPYWEYLPARIDGELVRRMRAASSDEIVRRILGLEIQMGLPFQFTNWEDIRKSLSIPNPSMGPLMDALKDEEEETRFTAATALQEIGNKTVVGPLIESLKDESSDVRHQVVYALGAIGDGRAVEPLTEALEDEDENVRKAAEYAIKKIKVKL